MLQMQEKESLDFKTVVLEFLKYWKLFMICVLVCVFAAVVYVKLSTKQYRVYSTILFNTNDNKRSVKDESYLEGYQIVNRDKQFKNEVVFYSSTPLLKKVIRKMGLEVSYYSNSSRIPSMFFLGFDNIYKESPFTVIFDRNHIQPTNTFFSIELVNDETFKINAYNPEGELYDYTSDIVVNNRFPFQISGKYKYGEQIINDICSFTILLNANYNPELFKNKNLFFVFENIEGLAINIQNELNLRAMMMESTLAEVYFVWDNPELAINFVDNLTTEYIALNLDDKNKFANSTLKYIDAQISNISDSLGLSEQELQNFRSSNNIVDISKKADKLYDQLKTLEDERSELNQSIRNTEYLHELFASNQLASDIVLPSTSAIEEGILSDLLEQLSELKSERDLMTEKDQLKNPRYKTLNSSIENLVKTIIQNINFYLSSSRRNLKEINANIRLINNEIALLPSKERKLINIERRYNMTDAAYTSLMEKRIQAQIAKASTEPDCIIIEPTRFDALAFPNTKIILIIGLFLGLFLPAAYILLINFFSNTINRVFEIKSIIKDKTLGYIPYFNKATSNVVNNSPHTNISESFYTLRSNIAYQLVDNEQKVILVTSSVPNEGKSFIALNLATSFAKVHNKVLLIDFDMRKQSNTYNMLNDNSSLGLSQFLIDQQSLDDIIIETNVPNLDYIPSGDIPPSPIELLSSPNTSEMIETLKEAYDYIIIDTPPFALLTDAFMLMRHSDINLYIVRLGIAQRKSFEYSMEDINTKKISNINFIINDSSKSSGGYHYKGSYYGDINKRKYKLFKRKRKKVKQE